MSDVTVIGLDLAKSVFQLCGLNRARKVIFNTRVSRAKLLDAIRAHPDALIAMEACAGAHYWARTVQGMGYSVRLIPAQHVKAFCRGNKSDAHDALAIAEAVFRPGIHAVPVKTLEQQDIQVRLRIRSRYKELRKGNANQIRGLLNEYGIVLPKTLLQFDRHLPDILATTDNGLTPVARAALQDLYAEHLSLSQKIRHADGELKTLAETHPSARVLLRLRGIGPITALALFAAIGNAQQFHNARQLAAWLGLVPKQHGSGGKIQLGSISKRGNTYLRMLLIHGARTVMTWMKPKSDRFSLWAKALVQRRGKHKTIVAMANKTARMVWVALHKGPEAVPLQHLSATSA